MKYKKKQIEAKSIIKNTTAIKYTSIELKNKPQFINRKTFIIASKFTIMTIQNFSDFFISLDKYK